MPTINEIYRQEFLKKQRLYEKRISRAFGKVARDISILVTDPQAKFVKSFDFSKQEKLTKKIDSIMLDFESEYSDIIQQSATDMWNLSNEKNDKITDKFIRTITFLSEAKKLTYYQNNLDALKSFIQTEKSFSESIWKVTQQLRGELEIHLGFGIMNGDSADTISRRIRYYLKKPEMLFRRVRDEKGNLVLSENAKQFNPGTGTYRSSYKNALRLTRTTINQAYLTADHVRWLQLDFVLGKKIQVSATHWERMPKGDICDIVQGIYPKWFKFVGWHPQCLCYATPILMSMEDFKRQLRGENKNLIYVKNVPDAFNNWISDNAARVNRFKHTPYFIRDNFNNGSIIQGLKY